MHALNKPSPQRKLGSMLLFEMDSSFRWNDENRLIQRFQSFALELGRPQAGESSICKITVAHGVSSHSCAGRIARGETCHEPPGAPGFHATGSGRSDGGRVGKESVSTVRSGWAP